MRSLIAYTWSRKCETNRIATPWSRRPRNTVKRFSTSTESRLDVGSSRMRTLASITMARLMATSCCMAMEMDASGWRESRCSSPMARRDRFAAACVARQLMPKAPRTSWPSMRFSPMLRFVQRLTSWYTVAMPARWASAVLWSLRSSPRTVTDPESIS